MAGHISGAPAHGGPCTPRLTTPSAQPPSPALPDYASEYPSNMHATVLLGCACMLGLSAWLHQRMAHTAPANRGPQVLNSVLLRYRVLAAVYTRGGATEHQGGQSRIQLPSFSACGPLPKMSCSSVRDGVG
jgi:hypothetical protein